MLHSLRKAAPRASLTAVNPKAACKCMKMITLPKLRDSLRDRSRGKGARRYRLARPDPDRAHARDRLTKRPAKGAGSTVSG